MTKQITCPFPMTNAEIMDELQRDHSRGQEVYTAKGAGWYGERFTRCKDCKHPIATDDVIYECGKGHEWNKGDFFCADGERSSHDN